MYRVNHRRMTGSARWMVRIRLVVHHMFMAVGRGGHRYAYGSPPNGSLGMLWVPPSPQGVARQLAYGPGEDVLARSVSVA